MEGTDQHVLTHHSTKTLHLLGMEETFNSQSTSFYKELKKVGGGGSSCHHHQGNISVKFQKKKKRNPEYALMFTEEEAMEWDL